MKNSLSPKVAECNTKNVIATKSDTPMIGDVTDSSRKAFSDRLREAMLAEGFRAPRSQLGADPSALRNAAGVRSIESARKWLSGTSMPSPERTQKIAEWLGVRVAWLRDGEGPMRIEYEKLPNNASVIADTREVYDPRVKAGLETLIEAVRSGDVSREELDAVLKLLLKNKAPR